MACVAVSLVDFRALRGACEMKLIRFGEMGREKPGVLLEDGTRLDVSGFGSDYDEDFFAGSGIAKLRNWLARQGASSLRVRESVRLGPPICRPSKIVCIGLNFRDHAQESGMEIPKEPVIFFKATSALVGPNDPLVIPKNATKVDWEVELAVVMEKKASYVSRETAMDHVAGFALHNDYSERSFQLERGGQWVKGKRSEEHTSELQSHSDLVCRLLLEKKKVKDEGVLVE